MTGLNGFCGRILAGWAVAAIALGCGASPADPAATGAQPAVAGKTKPHLLTPAEQAAMRRAIACNESGFPKDSDSYRLCLLLQQQNDRLTLMEERLRRIETQTFPYATGPYPYRGPWY